MVFEILNHGIYERNFYLGVIPNERKNKFENLRFEIIEKNQWNFHHNLGKSKRIEDFF